MSVRISTQYPRPREVKDFVQADVRQLYLVEGEPSRGIERVIDIINIFPSTQSKL